MSTPKIFESEYRFCLILWEHEPLPSAELARLCREKLGWSRTTTYTVIHRLSERGVVKNENGIVSSLVSKDDVQASELLRQAGYGDESCERCVARLVCRFRESSEFPHEVGLFLSYPPEDVKGFINHCAGGFKCAGLWKVYGDEEKARSLFEKYRKCTEIYCTLWQSGLKLEQLAVAV